MSDSIRQQSKALENRFFEQVDEKLLEQIRQNLAHMPKREALSTVSNIKDPHVLDKLLDLGLDASTFAVITFVPLAVVGWANGVIDSAEKRALLDAAEQHGIHKDKPGYVLLEKWLEHPPSAEIVQGWKEYIHALKAEMDPSWLAALKTVTLEQAERIAMASGGILGMGNKISASERAKLDELARAFN